MANNRNLKAYARYDGSGRIIPGSNILRKNEPKNGNWKELQAYACCNPIPLDPNCIYFTIEATEDNLDFWFNLESMLGGPNLLGSLTWGDGTVDDIFVGDGDDVRFNHTFPNVGTFSGTICVDNPINLTQIIATINED